MLKYDKLMVLGKPGAGKTTFLKYLAMQCIEGDLFVRKIPIFVTLKDFAESVDRVNIVKYIENWVVFSPVGDILKAGAGLILLDGLDEVREEDTVLVLQQIQDLVKRFSGNPVVITCRIAAKDYTFSRIPASA